MTTTQKMVAKLLYRMIHAFQAKDDPRVRVTMEDVERDVVQMTPLEPRFIGYQTQFHLLNNLHGGLFKFRYQAVSLRLEYFPVKETLDPTVEMTISWEDIVELTVDAHIEKGPHAKMIAVALVEAITDDEELKPIEIGLVDAFQKVLGLPYVMDEGKPHYPRSAGDPDNLRTCTPEEAENVSRALRGIRERLYQGRALDGQVDPKKVN
jgi:hypothetical protein